MSIPPRKLEEEVMMGREEAAAYDGLTRKFLDILHAGFVESVVNLAPAQGRRSRASTCPKTCWPSPA
jgi:hypothetical protein